MEKVLPDPGWDDKKRNDLVRPCPMYCPFSKNPAAVVAPRVGTSRRPILARPLEEGSKPLQSRLPTAFGATPWDEGGGDGCHARRRQTQYRGNDEQDRGIS